ncbi:hypothetical protein B0H13DRAFT_1051963 [Mycena leptocephala]|nr:hypothetical protein B0H13DRAFT_1051963 [Mycena leptocephala]
MQVRVSAYHSNTRLTIIVCRIHEETVTESLEREAVALVGSYFKGGIKIVDIEKQTTAFSLLSVIVDTEGCSADTTNIFSIAVADAPQTLSKVLKNAPGVPRIAVLYHYSCLHSCNLSRRIDVPKVTFDKARIMRSTYTYIQACLLHPALQEFSSDRSTMYAVLKRFEEQRTSVVKLAPKDSDDRKKIDALQRELKSSKDKADVLIRRYDFIRIVADMDKGIVSHPPSLVNGLHFYRWDCGKTGAPKKVKVLEEYNLVCFEPSYRAFELEWHSPVTDPAFPFRQFPLLGGPPRGNMTFSTRASNYVLPPLPPPLPKGHKLSKPHPASPPPEGTENPATFAFCLTDHKPVYILGWSISCYWPEGKSEPTIEVGHPTNHILSDRLSISIDNSRSAQWHCKVTFVIQSSYNFPDLV